MRPALALLLLALLAYWPAMSSPSWRGTEGRRVQIAAEMVQSGDLIVPTLGHEVTLAKPPLYYWVLAAVQKGFGAGFLAMRLPSVLALWLAAVAAYRALRPIWGKRAGAIAGVGLLWSPWILYHGGRAEIDPMFAAMTAVSLLWLANGVAFGGRARFFWAGVVGGLAVMTKGPPYLMFLAGSLVVWCRHASLRPIPWFLVPLLVIPGSYYFLLQSALAEGAVGDSGIGSVAARETLGRLFEFEWHHVADIPVHFVRAILASMPLGLWTLAEFRGRHEARLQPPEILMRMCVGAAIGAVLILTVFPLRPMRYLLPGILLFTIAVAPAVAAFTFVRLRPRFGQLLTVRGFGIAGCIGLVVAPWIGFPVESTAWLMAALAVAPFVVRTRSALVGYALAMPMIAFWTVLPDRDRVFAHGTRSTGDVSALVREELDRRSIDDLQTYGHLTSGILLQAGIDVPGDELRARKPSARWLLLEDGDTTHYGVEQSAPEYADRVRIRGHGRTFVLKERSGR